MVLYRKMMNVEACQELRNKVLYFKDSVLLKIKYILTKFRLGIGNYPKELIFTTVGVLIFLVDKQLFCNEVRMWLVAIFAFAFFSSIQYQFVRRGLALKIFIFIFFRKSLWNRQLCISNFL